MSCTSTCYKIAIAVLLAMVSFFAKAQSGIDCGKTAKFIPRIEQKIERISTTDPEVISLHYLFAKDLMDEIAAFRENAMPQLHLCPEIDFYATKKRLDTLEAYVSKLLDTLDIQRHRVDTIFYLMAVDEINLQDTTLADYYLDRSLQFNRLNTDALILKAKILFQKEEYDECIQEIHILYNEAPLNRAQENELSDFTALFYDHLFTTGDSLVKAGLGAEALPIFETLSTFCHDMPSSYCNDDYYHGIIRSKSGVYESYLVIAQVAWDKNNPEIAYKFIDYAQQYLAENPDEIEISKQYEDFVRILQANRWRYHLDDDTPPSYDTPEPKVEPEVVTPETPQESNEQKQEVTMPEELPVAIVIDPEKQREYDLTLINALYEYINGNTKQAAAQLKIAIEMEQCNCLVRDDRAARLLDLIESNKK